MPGEPASAVLNYGGAVEAACGRPPLLIRTVTAPTSGIAESSRGAAVKAADSEAIVMRGYRAPWLIFGECALSKCRPGLGSAASVNRLCVAVMSFLS
jgi:hypothetical protein